MIVSRRLGLATERGTQFIDITDLVEREIIATGLRNGRVYLQSLHTTLGITVNENEPLLIGDFENLLDRLAPSAAAYLHDDFGRRAGVPLDEPANGHAHCRLLLLAPSQTLLVEDGRLLLGRWQSVFAVELDGPRKRELAVQLEGDFSNRPKPRVDGELLEQELSRQLEVDPGPLREPMRRLVEAGGKRVRPALVGLTGRLGPNYDPLRSSTLAAAVELIHSATLVHDDYVDEAPVRRSRATVAALEGPRRAIEVGDYYFAKATRVIAELGSPAVTSTIAEAMEAICAAQIDDVALRGSYPGDHASYLKVVRGKTAALMAAACASGAQLSGTDPKTVDRLRRFGDMLGIAFQMADDIVDFSGTSGKQAGQDIRERTLSLPLIYATEHEELGGEVRALLEGPLSDDQVERVTELVKESGALERAGAEALALVELAIQELDFMDLDGVREPLTDLAYSAVNRSS